MIRRWSYINNINSLTRTNSFSIQAASLDVVLNTLMYLRKDFPLSSQAFRKNWARRKHLNSLPFLANIMINWAKEYRFYKNYNRSLTYQYFFKNTYLSINLIIQKKSNSTHLARDTSALGSSITRRLVKFFQNLFFLTRFHAFPHFKNSSWSYASFIEVFNEKNTLQSNASHTPAYLPSLTNNSLLAINVQNDKSFFTKTLFKVIFSLILSKNIELRKIYTQMMIFKTF